MLITVRTFLSSLTGHPELVHFPPYNKDQIIEILNERLKDVSCSYVCACVCTGLALSIF